jgi:hypothetical protein
MKIGEEWKVDVVVLGISLMTPGAVDRNAKNFGTIVLKFRADLVVKGDLVAANRAPVGRVKRKDDAVATQFAERQILIRRNAQSELGRRCSWRQKLGHDGLPLMQRGRIWRSPRAATLTPVKNRSTRSPTCAIDGRQGVAFTFYSW